MIMPPSPALKISPGRELKASNHKRGHSFESGILIREKDDDLALFSEMQNREREGFLLQSAEDLEDSFSSKLRYFSDLKLGISIPVRGENSELLNADGEKNDYDWLLTPPDTPLFPSLDDEPPSVTITSRGRPRSQPISISRSSTMEKSHRSSTSRGSASPNRLSPSPRSANSVPQMRGRPSSASHSSPTPSIRHATPSRRPTTPTRRSSPPPSTPSTSVPRSSTPTPRRMSTGSSGIAVTSGVRGTSPVKSVRGNSSSPKISAWQTNIPGFSSDAPPNLRTSLADRPASYVRGSSPASRNSRDLAHKHSRQSMSPTASRSISSSHSHDRDQYSSYSKGSIASSGDDDLDSLQSIHASSFGNSSSKGGGIISNNKALVFSKKPARIVSSSSAPKRSFDSTIRQLDRKSPNMFRPLLSSVPSTTFYTGKASSAHRSLISRNSSVTTSSNASSDHGASIALDQEGSDHNQYDMASECDKVPYSDNHEEIFAFDKMDIVDENSTDDIKSFDRRHSFGCDPVVAGDRNHQAILPEISSTSNTPQAKGGMPEVVCLEDTVLCSRCGSRYSVIDTEENNVNICPDCSREKKFLGRALLENMTAVAESLSGLSSKTYEADKPLEKAESLVILPESSLATGMDESRIFEGNDEQDQATCSQQSQSNLKENFPSETLVEEGRHSLINHLEMSKSVVSGIQPNNESGYQQPLHHNDYQTLKFDASEGAGISILLKRSSSSKGPVVQGRTFTASTISYDDLSYARDSMSSLRSSIGHSSFSASSSADFTSCRQIETRMQRQLSSRKGDVENKKCEISVKSHSSEADPSGTTANAPPVLGFATCKQENNLDVSGCNLDFFSNQETTTSSHKPELGSENTESDDTSSIMETVGEDDKDKVECNNCRALEASTSESSREDLSGARSVSDREVSGTTLDSSVVEGHDMLDKSVYEGDVMEVTAHSISETETKQLDEVIARGSQNDLSMISKNPSVEPVVFDGSDQDLTTSVLDPEKSDGILEESTVIVDCQGRTKTRSLTLEEATDTILFCSSIVHDLAYSAAAIAIEKENQVTLEDSQPMVTILGKSNTDRSYLRNRTGGKRVMKSQKPRQRRVETNTKSLSGKTENDENTDESTIRNVGLPNQVDSMKPPKLESKCNCSIM